MQEQVNAKHDKVLQEGQTMKENINELDKTQNNLAEKIVSVFHKSSQTCTILMVSRLKMQMPIKFQQSISGKLIFRNLCLVKVESFFAFLQKLVHVSALILRNMIQNYHPFKITVSLG